MAIPDFSQVRLLVAGDVMLDRYWSGSTSRISPEAPVPVVNVRGCEHRAGGAANVALGLAALGARTQLMGRVGTDEAADVLERLLADAGVACAFERDPLRATITKLRVISHHQQMIRLDFEPAADAAAALPVAAFAGLLGGVDAVVLSDYGKGALLRVQELIQGARAAGKPVLVDPKQSDFSVYRDATVLTPNRGEFERAAGPCRDEAELVDKGLAMIERLGWQGLLITRGEEGMSVLERGQPPLHIPARTQEVYDVTGAGDTVVAVLAAAMAAGRPLREAATLANLAAGIAVGKLGTATVSLAELEQAAFPAQAQAGEQGVVSEDALARLLTAARRRGERIVMTNGCFDILHPGHVAYLREARRLGDRLIVAVNDDHSVRRLKGAERPVNPLAYRMAVLAGLASVDWVLPFSEDTPEQLIQRLAPDVLAKGGDYRVEQIAGHRSVLERGGEVRIIPFRDGYSTTGVIGKIRDGKSSDPT